jgi:hypothetical protein
MPSITEAPRGTRGRQAFPGGAWERGIDFVLAPVAPASRRYAPSSGRGQRTCKEWYSHRSSWALARGRLPESPVVLCVRHTGERRCPVSDGAGHARHRRARRPFYRIPVPDRSPGQAAGMTEAFIVRCDSSFEGGYPNRPVTYSMVRSTLGLVNTVAVSPYSIRRPRYMKAVLSDTRAACCMLWVTMTMVYLPRRS